MTLLKSEILRKIRDLYDRRCKVFRWVDATLKSWARFSKKLLFSRSETLQYCVDGIFKLKDVSPICLLILHGGTYELGNQLRGTY